MKSLIHKITGGLGRLSHWLLSFGPFGLLAIAFLDSVLVPIPGGVDAMLLLLAAARPSWLLIYVAAAMIGSLHIKSLPPARRLPGALVCIRFQNELAIGR